MKIDSVLHFWFMADRLCPPPKNPDLSDQSPIPVKMPHFN